MASPADPHVPTRSLIAAVLALAFASTAAFAVPVAAARSGPALPSEPAQAVTEAAPPPSPADPSRPLDDPGLLEVVRARLGTRATLGVDARVPVEVLHGGFDDAVVARIVELGGAVTGSAPGTLVQASVPIGTLALLATSPGVTYVRRPVEISLHPQQESIDIPNAGIITSQAVSIMNAAAWHTAGITGSGVRIGVIDFFNGSKWDVQVTQGEVPPVSGTFCRDLGAACSIWDDTEDGHGNAVAETIHDLAPGAQLYLATLGSLSDYYAAMDWFAANGVRIVTRSLGSPYDGPGDGTGPLGALADYATVRGITLFNSAGNEGSYQYYRGAFADANGNGYMEFAPGDETLDLIDPSTGFGETCGGIMGVRWDDWNGVGGIPTNYDVLLLSGGVQIWPPLSGGPDQQAGAPPIEMQGIGGCTGAPLSLKIRRLAPGSELNDVMEVLIYDGHLQYWQAAGSAGGPIVDSRNAAVVAVGAIDPPASGAVATYSSQGPTNDGRIKPDVSAPSCFSNSIYTPFCFNGTSAASPAAAAIGALALSAGLATEPATVAAIVKHFVLDRGAPFEDTVYGSGEVRLPAPPNGTISTSPSAFTAVTPTRLYDSRTTRPTPHPQHDIVDLAVAGANGVPADATAVALNVTLTEAAGAGYVQVQPTMRPALGRAATTSIEFAAQTLPNFSITPIGQAGRVTVYAPAGGHVVVDLLGYYRASGTTAAGRYVPLVPSRVLDTRESATTNPNQLPSGWSDHKPGIGEVITLDFKAASGLPSSGVSAVVLNLVGTEPDLPGYVTAYPAGQSPPLAANLNLTPGSTNANLAMVGLGADRRVSFFVQAGTHLVADLAGYITDGSAPSSTSGRFVPLGPDRLLDTRITGPAFAGLTPRTVSVGGNLGVPTNAIATSFNFSITRSALPGYLQAWPTGSAPATLFANLNWSRTDQTISGAGIVKLGPDGAVNAMALTTTDVIVDVNGWFTP